MNPKTNPGHFFEDFRVGQRLVHATPRTVTAGDVALYTALYGTRFAVHSSAAFAAQLGLPQAPVAGVKAAIAVLAHPRCTASSSSPDRLQLALEVTGLAPHFGARDDRLRDRHDAHRTPAR